LQILFLLLSPLGRKPPLSDPDQIQDAVNQPLTPDPSQILQETGMPYEVVAEAQVPQVVSHEVVQVDFKAPELPHSNSASFNPVDPYGNSSLVLQDIQSLSEKLCSMEREQKVMRSELSAFKQVDFPPSLCRELRPPLLF